MCYVALIIMEKKVTYINSSGEHKTFVINYDNNTSYQELDKIVKNELEYSLGYIPEWWYS